MRTVVVVGSFIVSAAVAALVIAWPSSAQQQAAPILALPAGAVPPPGMMMQGTKMEAFLARPERIVVRDLTEIGVIEHEQNGEGPHVRVQTVTLYDEAKPAERLQGMALIVDNTVDPFTILFDVEQIPRLQEALAKLMATATALRITPRETRRHAVYSMNGLEVAIRAGGADGGYVGRAGLDQPTVRMAADDFVDLRDLLEQARTSLAREAARHAAGKPEEGTP